MIILASSSPRRKEIFDMMGIKYKIVPSSFDESSIKVNKIKDYPKELSFNKAKEVFNLYKDDIVIGADTIVTIDDEVLGKPVDRYDGYRMLSKLNNRIHKVITGVTIMSKFQTVSFIDVSYVKFNKLSIDIIEKYLDTKEGMDKAGSYAIQGIGGSLIKHIKGDYYNIMGFPYNKFSKIFNKFLKNNKY